MAITITDVSTILTAPAGIRLVVVKIETSEPGLYGLGCATFTQRYAAVAAAIDRHLKPFLIGKDVQRIEDLFQTMMVNGYWRNGPVLNNAISGVDIALWDIKGKLANMPVYQLLGGKCREAAALYRHADGHSPEQVAESALRYKEEGYQYIRCQMGGYGGRGDRRPSPEGAVPGAYYDADRYWRSIPAMFEKVRSVVGFDVEVLHDVHERLQPAQVVQLAKALEPYQLFFLEDPLAPEQVEWFRTLRHHTVTPIAMGELFVNVREWLPLVAEQLIDFTRAHISAIGGITPARKMAMVCEVYGVRTAWHGPGDVSPVGHAANLHLDVSSPNFGIQECYFFPDSVREVFPGCPEIRNGYMYPNDKPGLGIDIDEQLAAKYPCSDFLDEWTQARLPDGTPARP
ncbi:MAG TPA: enolase C-terminal domain-like protein [Roseiflexaceae bacterium]|nr:enolase C-terminal domain-like protein [Roseiflexaceae bacterium]